MKKKSSSTKQKKEKSAKPKVRYGVIGLGYISQAAVLPSFAHAGANSELTALVSSDAEKLEVLGKKYKVPHLYAADQYDACLENPEVDAVYIALPNSLHCEYTVRAAEMGKHVLCEKPLGVTRRECARMIEACERNGVKLMTGYRLHFDPANLQTIETVRSGKIGEPRVFSSTFSYSIHPESHARLQAELGGGPLFDIGIYCINAARYLFQSEPIEVSAICGISEDPKLSEVEESISAILRFPGDRLAQFTASFGAADSAFFSVLGTKGSLCLEQAYELADERSLCVKVGEKETEKKFEKIDQFSPELLHFSDCVLNDREPEPSGIEGLIDVAIIEHLYRSAASGKAVALAPLPQKDRPTKRLEMKKPAVPEQELIHAVPPAA